MKKFWIQFLVLITIILSAMYLVYNPAFIKNLGQVSTSTIPVKLSERNIRVGETVISVELADTTEKRKIGLSGRLDLAENKGMLFVFPEEKKYQLWMKGMKFSLDFIFINKGKVVDIMKNVPSPIDSQKDQDLALYEPIVPVDMLLEVKAGFADRQTIKNGDIVSLTE